MFQVQNDCFVPHFGHLIRDVCWPNDLLLFMFVYFGTYTDTYIMHTLLFESMLM